MFLDPNAREIRLGGKSRTGGPGSKDDFLSKKRKEREDREKTRRREAAAQFVQRCVRGHIARVRWRRAARKDWQKKADDAAKCFKILPQEKHAALLVRVLPALLRPLLLFFAPEDAPRLRTVQAWMQASLQSEPSYCSLGDERHLWALTKLLTLLGRFAPDLALPLVARAPASIVPKLWPALRAAPKARLLALPADEVEAVFAALLRLPVEDLGFVLEASVGSRQSAEACVQSASFAAWLPAALAAHSHGGIACDAYAAALVLEFVIERRLTSSVPAATALLAGRSGPVPLDARQLLDKPGLVKSLAQSLAQLPPGVLPSLLGLYFPPGGPDPKEDVLKCFTCFSACSPAQSVTRRLFELLWPTLRDPSAVKGDEACLRALCAVFHVELQSMHDSELQDPKVCPLFDHMSDIALGLNRLAYEQVCAGTRAFAAAAVRELFIRNTRVRFTTEDEWVLPQSAHVVVNGLDSHVARDDEGSLGGMLHPVLAQLPHAVPFPTRVGVFYYVLQDDQDRRQSRHRIPWGPNSFHQVRRPQLLLDGVEHLNALSPNELRDTFRVQFVEGSGLAEAGIDGGGLFKEFLLLLAREAVNPEAGLFVTVGDERLCVPAPLHLGQQMYGSRLKDMYVGVGRAIGKAIYEECLLEPRFALPFLSLLLGRTNSIDELSLLDPELHKSLMYVKDCAPADVEALCLTFSATTHELGTTKEIDLIPGGKDMAVTAENRIKYMHYMAHYRANTAILQQARWFAQGIYDVIQKDWLKMFGPEELNELISGSQTAGFDIDDLRRNTHYSGGYADSGDANGITVNLFWKVLREFSAEDLGRFLMFVTSCSRPPLNGFKQLTPKFAIHRVPEPDRLPTASTCANLLKLPDYKDAELMKKKLRIALDQNTGFFMS